jgi:DivIVA domain-containing protein
VFWFQLVTVAGVLFGVAAVAAGRGGSMSEAVPDHPEVTLPDGPVSRADLEGLRFPLAFRGYRMADVDAVLDRLGAELAERDARIQELTRGGSRPVDAED